jgi:hypothetical protein
VASEISLTVVLTATKSFLSLDRRATLNIDMTGTRYGSTLQTIGTSNEALNLNADIGTSGVFYLRNTDATNFVTIGVRDGSSTYIPLIKLKPGEVATGRLATSAVYAQANTANVVLEHTVLED